MDEKSRRLSWCQFGGHTLDLEGQGHPEAALMVRGKGSLYRLGEQLPLAVIIIGAKQTLRWEGRGCHVSSTSVVGTCQLAA